MSILLKIGLGGLVDHELMTFDYAEGDRMKPYVCKILGRSFEYGFERKFVTPDRMAHPEEYHGKRVHLLSFKLEPYHIYEYKRFMGEGPGEIEEGYFGLYHDDFVELEREAVETLCGNFRVKAIAAHDKRLKLSAQDKRQMNLKGLSGSNKTVENPPKKEAESAPMKKEAKKETQTEFNFAPDDIPF